VSDPFEQLRSGIGQTTPDKPAIWDKMNNGMAAGVKPNLKAPGRAAKLAGVMVAVLVIGVATPLSFLAARHLGGTPGSLPASQPPSTSAPATPEPVQLVTGTIPIGAAAQMAALSEPLFPLVIAAAESPVNPAYSPLSVYLALALTANGASGEAADQFAALLGGSREQVNQLAAGMMTEYVTTGGGPTLAVANSLWLDNQFAVNPDFEREAQAIFRSEVVNLDLATAGADRINAWVAQKTNQLIKQIVTEIPPNTLACLVNALYFKGAWLEPFMPLDTEDRPFTLADGTVVQVPTMYGHISVESFFTETADGVILPYVGERFGMVVALPKGGVDQITWDGTTWNATSQGGLLPTGGVDQIAWDGNQIASWLAAASTEHGTMNVYLPKWESKLAAELTEPLQQLGLTEPFNPSTNTLAGIGEPAGFISEVAHGAVVKVDEKGTEAAAATQVIINQSMGSDIYFDRPFVYAIVDLRNGLPLFIGQVDNPLVTP